MNTFKNCTTRTEVSEDFQRRVREHPAAIELREFKKALREERKVREREIRNAELAPFEDEAKRWKHGDVVFFGKPDNRSYMSMDDLRVHKAYDIPKGGACRVWSYQPRKKIAWLCIPGTPCKRGNVIEHAFSLSDIKNAQISRTELQLRRDT